MYEIDGTRVYGNGKSFNCLNKVTAIELQGLLNDYERTSVQFRDIDGKLDKVQKSVISLQMSVSIISDELQKLHEEIICR